MRPALWVVLAAALATSPALAESSVPLSPPPPPPQEHEREGTNHDPSDPGRPNPSLRPAAEVARPPAMAPGRLPSASSSSFASRLGGEAVGGVLGELSLGLLGGYIGYTLEPGHGGLFPRLTGVFTGGTAGVFLGGGLGVFAGAALAGGRGSLLAAFAGSAIGTVMTYLLTYTLVQADGPLFAAALLCPTLGAMIGYEVFQPPPLPVGRPPTERAAENVRLLPVVSLAPGGERALFGLAGRF